MCAIESRGELQILEQRRRMIQKKFRVTEKENQMIANNMQAANMRSFSAYARKMVFDGFVVNQNFSELRELTKELNKIGTNINQISKKLNTSGNFYKDDLNLIKFQFDQLCREINEELLLKIREGRQE